MKQEINIFFFVFIYRSLKQKQEEKLQDDYIHWDFYMFT